MPATEILLDGQSAAYRSESFQTPPRRAQSAAECSAEAVLRAAQNGTATLWHGDYHNAKQVLAALKKRIRPAQKRQPENPEADPAAVFHRHRLAQSQAARAANMLLVEIRAGFTLRLARAPQEQIRAVLADVYGTPDNTPFLLPLNQLLGFIGAHEWHKKGVSVPEAGGTLHIPYGVFSPLRGEYLSLLAQAPLPPHAQTAFDIGTGSGVIAALLAKRGIPHITATDTNPRAAACARANLARLGFAAQTEVLQQDLFPPSRANLIVCNPPWLPAKPTSVLETALYDPAHAMLHAFLRGAAAHLEDGGQAWLVMSDLAEHLGLRSAGSLQNWFAAYGWRVSGSLKTAPQHPKARHEADPLAFARRRETTTLYILERT